jgi:DNA-binding beta-propeller fold protein YncE
MPRRSLLAVLVLVGLSSLLCLALDVPRQPAPPRPATPRVLPGIQANGFIQLPNQWSLRPAGKQIELGDFPVNLALHPSGAWLAVLHAGFSEHEIIIVDLKRQRPTCRVPLDQTFLGLAFAPDGRTLFASGAEYEVIHAYEFTEGLLGRHRALSVVAVTDKFVVGGIAVNATGTTLFAAGPFGDAVVILPLESDKRTRIDLEKESHPYTVLPDAFSKRLYVSLWNRAALAVIDLETKKVTDTWPTEKHPTEMALDPDGKLLYVACANSTRVSVLDAKTGKALQTLNCALYPTAPSGNTPNSLSLTPDGKVLFVANADANNLAVFSVAEPGQAKPLGHIPVGWYPTSVRYNPVDRRIYVANGKGASPKANPHGPNPNLKPNATVLEYIGSLMRGSLSIIDLPGPENMPEHSKRALACSPLRSDAGVIVEPPADSPIPGKVGAPSPIKYCIYIIKENRTYDQVFGDMKEGNGDPNLCLFPDKVTPNHHQLARDFVLLDNFYCDGEVSADGHEWSMGAYCTDFVEKIWPLTYRGSRLKKLPAYPAEGEKEAIARPAGGYLWNRCAEARVSYRNYGEWIRNGKTVKDPGTPKDKALEGHFDPWFRGFDMDYSDQKRADRFIEELARFEKDGDMPRLQILRLPNDHTAGTMVGKWTPTACVADNDLALGRVIEAISKSKFWKETAVFVVEDDAQNGPDHVDAHRTVAFVISPYTKRGQVDSNLYSTSSMVRTIELILGLQPMSQFDAAARPMYASFQGKADVRPYQHLPANVDIDEKNKATAWGADKSEKFDLSKEDAVDDLVFNQVIWHSVRGPNEPMPAPVRAAFVFPHLKEKKDDDD